ncbi:hypothetical protein XENORESO_021333 [Xenotaenia resolanae]|uniref:Uncharacterized protein n=1 Tax=Xenotaenia resolanae TaxID=208358 RepID=A0ABV0VTK0_9TELE
MCAASTLWLPQQLPHGHLSFFNSSRTIAARTIYAEVCFVMLNVHSPMTPNPPSFSEENCKYYHPRTPLCATMQHLKRHSDLIELSAVMADTCGSLLFLRSVFNPMQTLEHVW